MIKGANLFVFAKEDSAAPKYAVELTHKKISLHEALGHTQVVTLESGLGDVEYKFKFDLRENPELAKNFAVAMREQVAVGESNEVKQVCVDFVCKGRMGFEICISHHGSMTCHFNSFIRNSDIGLLLMQVNLSSMLIQLRRRKRKISLMLLSVWER